MKVIIDEREPNDSPERRYADNLMRQHQREYISELSVSMLSERKEFADAIASMRANGLNDIEIIDQLCLQIFGISPDQK